MLHFLLHFRVVLFFRNAYLSVLRSRRIAYNVPTAWRSLGIDYMSFGLSLTVKGRAEVLVITLTPILPNRLLGAGIFLFVLYFKFINLCPNIPFHSLCPSKHFYTAFSLLFPNFHLNYI